MTVTMWSSSKSIFHNLALQFKCHIFQIYQWGQFEYQKTMSAKSSNFMVYLVQEPMLAQWLTEIRHRSQPTSEMRIGQQPTSMAIPDPGFVGYRLLVAVYSIIPLSTGAGQVPFQQLITVYSKVVSWRSDSERNKFTYTLEGKLTLRHLDGKTDH